MSLQALWCQRIARRMQIGLDYTFFEVEEIAESCRPRGRWHPDLRTMLLHNVHGHGAGDRLFRVREVGGVIEAVRLYEASEDPELARRWEARQRAMESAERDRVARIVQENVDLRRRLDEEMPVLRAALTRVEQLGLVGALVVMLRHSGAGTARWIGEFIGRRVD